MTLTEFIESIDQSDLPSEGLSTVLQALWYERKGDWNRAHQIAQNIHTSRGGLDPCLLAQKGG